MRRLGIDAQTVLGMPPVEHIELADKLDCTHVSLGLSPPPWKLDMFPVWSLRNDRSLQRETLAAVRDTGVSILQAEGFSVRAGKEALDLAADLDVFAELGAVQASGVCMERDMARGLDQFALLAELTAERNMGFVMEFAPPHAVSTLDQALAAIEAIGNEDIRVVMDAMHYFRSGGTLARLAELDPGRIGYIQLCDVPMTSLHADYIKEACFERQIPGEGELPLREWLLQLPDDVPVGLETPMFSRAKGGVQLEEWVGRAVAATRHLLLTSVAQPAALANL